jgi:hypothetical protein
MVIPLYWMSDMFIKAFFKIALFMIYLCLREDNSAKIYLSKIYLCLREDNSAKIYLCLREDNSLSLLFLRFTYA